MENVFERDQLFLEVWSQPVTALAKKYGLSDNGLRKVCNALEIPLPPRGHWARIAAGHKIQPPPLPPSEGRTTYVSNPSTDVLVASPRNDPWLAERLAFEQDPANRIVVADQLVRAHPLVVEAAKRIKAQIACIEKSRDHERRRAERAKGAWTGVNFDSLDNNSWSNYMGRGGIIDLPSDVLPTRVSIESVSRALILWDAVIKACEARKMTIQLAERRLRVICGAESVALRISEQVNQVDGRAITLPDVEFPPFGGVRRLATGSLRIFLCDHGEKKFSDTEDMLLEQQLNELFQSIYRAFVSQRIQHSIWAEKRRLEQIAKQEAERERVELAAHEAAIAAENRRIDQLVAEAGTWRQAELVRAYVANLQALAAGAPVSDDLQTWLEWAAGAADRLDPSKGRLG